MGLLVEEQSNEKGLAVTSYCTSPENMLTTSINVKCSEMGSHQMLCKYFSIYIMQMQLINI